MVGGDEDGDCGLVGWAVGVGLAFGDAGGEAECEQGGAATGGAFE